MYALVYQCGLANVFRLSGWTDVPELAAFSGNPAKGRYRVLQHAFSPCEFYLQGLMEAGRTAAVFHCDECGDISGRDWKQGPGEMFLDAKRPPKDADHV